MLFLHTLVDKDSITMPQTISKGAMIERVRKILYFAFARFETLRIGLSEVGCAVGVFFDTSSKHIFFHIYFHFVIYFL